MKVFMRGVLEPRLQRVVLNPHHRTHRCPCRSYNNVRDLFCTENADQGSEGPSILQGEGGVVGLFRLRGFYRRVD